MNFWSTIEHSLQYKYKQHMPDHIREKLSRVADAIIVLDNEMSTVRSEIMDAQNSCQIQTNLVKDILNNIQNLYTIANKRELVKIQSFTGSMRQRIWNSYVVFTAIWTISQKVTMCRHLSDLDA